MSVNDVRLQLQQGVEIREEPFTLNAGGTSQIYADLRWPVLANPGPVADVFASFIVNNTTDENPAVGGCPLMGPILAALLAERLMSPSFAVRPEPKDHGTGRRIEGKIGGNVILVDDVFTTGSTLLDAIDALAELEVSVSGVFVLCDRSEGTTLRLKDVPVRSLFTLRELACDLPEYDGQT